ncbi:MAG: hypothetical protein KDC44_01980 [Phaeodactylibacter sp.]|nr:hypothetical protein [Phaeodactylibacter sp.]
MQRPLDELFLPEKSRYRENRRISFLLALLLLGFLAATAVSWYEVESIVISGAALSVIGLLLALVARRSRDKVGLILGLFPFVLSLLWLGIINGFDLSPYDCRTIVPASLVFAALFAWTLGGYHYLKNLRDQG